MRGHISLLACHSMFAEGTSDTAHFATSTCTKRTAKQFGERAALNKKKQQQQQRSDDLPAVWSAFHLDRFLWATRNPCAVFSILYLPNAGGIQKKSNIIEMFCLNRHIQYAEMAKREPSNEHKMIVPLSVSYGFVAVHNTFSAGVSSQLLSKNNK